MIDWNKPIRFHLDYPGEQPKFEVVHKEQHDIRYALLRWKFANREDYAYGIACSDGTLCFTVHNGPTKLKIENVPEEPKDTIILINEGNNRWFIFSQPICRTEAHQLVKSITTPYRLVTIE